MYTSHKFIYLFGKWSVWYAFLDLVFCLIACISYAWIMSIILNMQSVFMKWQFLLRVKAKNDKLKRKTIFGIQANSHNFW